MKFQHLPIGARFEFEAKIYSKTGPLTASAEAGGQRVIPRYADLTPLDACVPRAARKSPATLDPDKVKAAFDEFYAEAARRIDTSQQLALIQARERFFSGLGLVEVSTSP